jgi:PPM family protein phosphatase
MRLVSWGLSQAGSGRGHNEDAFVVEPERGFFFVADGMGSAKNGQMAAAMACDIIGQRVKVLLEDGVARRNPDEAKERLMRRLQLVFNEASETVYRRAQSEPACRGIATTASLLQIVGPIGVIGHVGDSRVYLVRGGKTYKVTEDHTLAQQLVRSGQLQPEMVATFPHRNVLSRSLGHSPAVDVDSLVVDVLPGDYFVLCTDGLSDHLRGRDIAAVVTQYDPEHAAPRLAQIATERGADDDVTLVIVAVHGDVMRPNSLRTEQKAALLGRVFLFKDLTFQEIIRVLAVVQEVRMNPGTALIRQGEKGDLIYFLVEGVATISRDGVRLGEVRAGDHFGELALVDDGLRHATVTAQTSCILLTLQKADFFQLVQSDHGLAIKLLWGLLQNLSGQIKDLSAELARARTR